MLRKQCPSVATGIAEFFRDQGYDVLLMMDSLTRFAMAQREIGLAVGEPPVSRGYTPSIYAELPKLLERSGNFQKGSITGVYTVLVEGDDTNEPIADTVRGILDGHIVLSRRLANSNHFPAIDIGASISRLMADIVSDEHKRLAARVRDVMGIYEKNADLVSVGAPTQGWIMLWERWTGSTSFWPREWTRRSPMRRIWRPCGSSCKRRGDRDEAVPVQPEYGVELQAAGAGGAAE